MGDMLVRLYDLPKSDSENTKFVSQGIEVRRAMAPDKSKVVQYVSEKFGAGWASECDVSFSNKPTTCFIALKNKTEIIGFACYEATSKGFFGPTGVSDEYRGMGIGKELLIQSLYGLKEMGYAYAIIGATDVYDFYSKTVDAIVIPKSDTSIYKNLIGYID